VNAIRILTAATAIGILLISGLGCEQAPTVTVYIDHDACWAVDADGNKIEPLWVFPKDRVVWVNSSDEDKTIKFDDATIFGVTDVPVAIGARAILTVKADASGTISYNIVPNHDCPTGAPKVSAGSGP
jgi:hypothetical protein